MKMIMQPEKQWTVTSMAPAPLESLCRDIKSLFQPSLAMEGPSCPSSSVLPLPCAGYTRSPAQPVYPQSQSSICHVTSSQSRHTAFCTILSSIYPPSRFGETLAGENSLGSIRLGETKTKQRMRQQGWFQHSMVEEGKGNGNPNQNRELGKNLPPPAPPKSSLTQQDDSSMFRVSGCWFGETSRCCIKPSISDVRFPPLSHFMFS